MNSVEWTLIGLGVAAFLIGVAVWTLDQFALGFAAGWAFGGGFWTYWVSRNKEDSK